MAESRFADISCHVEPSGGVSYSGTTKSSDDTVTASATTDAHGNLINGKWSHDDKQGIELSISFPDGMIAGRNAPKDPLTAEGLRDDRGEFLMRKIDACKKLSNINLF